MDEKLTSVLKEGRTVSQERPHGVGGFLLSPSRRMRLMPAIAAIGAVSAGAVFYFGPRQGTPNKLASPGDEVRARVAFQAQNHTMADAASSTSNEDMHLECDCGPLWECMQSKGEGEDCAPLEAALRACLLRIQHP